MNCPKQCKLIYKRYVEGLVQQDHRFKGFYVENCSADDQQETCGLGYCRSKKISLIRRISNTKHNYYSVHMMLLSINKCEWSYKFAATHRWTHQRQGFLFLELLSSERCPAAPSSAQQSVLDTGESLWLKQREGHRNVTSFHGWPGPNILLPSITWLLHYSTKLLSVRRGGWVKITKPPTRWHNSVSRQGCDEMNGCEQTLPRRHSKHQTNDWREWKTETDGWQQPRCNNVATQMHTF